MTKVWVVSCWLNRSSYDNSVLGVFTSEEAALRLARSKIDLNESYEQISEGYYEEGSSYNSSIISVVCLELTPSYINNPIIYEKGCNEVNEYDKKD